MFDGLVGGMTPAVTLAALSGGRGAAPAAGPDWHADARVDEPDAGSVDGSAAAAAVSLDGPLGVAVAGFAAAVDALLAAGLDSLGRDGLLGLVSAVETQRRRLAAVDHRLRSWSAGRWPPSWAFATPGRCWGWCCGCRRPRPARGSPRCGTSAPAED